MTLRSYVRLGAIGTIVLTACVIGALVFLTSAVEKLSNTLTARAGITHYIAEGAGASNYLTNEARLYTYTADAQHVTNYNERLAKDDFVVLEQQLASYDVPVSLREDLTVINDVSLVAAQMEIDAIQLVEQGEATAAQTLLTSTAYNEAIAEVDALYKTFNDNVLSWSTELAEQTNKQSAFSTFLIATLCILYSICVLTFFVLLLRKLKPLATLTTAAEQMAAGI